MQKITRFKSLRLRGGNKHAKASEKKKMCDPCTAKHRDKEAVYMCAHCDYKLLCKECSIHHQSSLSMKPHVLIEVDKFSKDAKKGSIVCDPCKKRGIIKEAFFICQQCNNEQLCGECNKTHRVMKSTKSHSPKEADKYAKDSHKENNFCDPCSTRGIKKEALFFCKQCDNELLCVQCSSIHQVMKSTKSHDLIEAEKYVNDSHNEKYFCDPCSTRDIKNEALYFCKKCDNELFCEECFSVHQAMMFTKSHDTSSVETYKKTGIKETQLCEPCAKRNLTVQACVFCSQCNTELLCKDCSSSHTTKMRSFSGHVLQDITQYQQYKSIEKYLCQPCALQYASNLPLCKCLKCGNDLWSDCRNEHKPTTNIHNHTLFSKSDNTEQNKKPSSYTTVQNASGATQTSKHQQPGKPTAIDIGLDTITITWQTPELCIDDGFYQISFQKTDDTQWFVYDGHFKSNTEKLTNFDPGCEYLLRVRFVSGEGDGPYSDASDVIQTLSPTSRQQALSVLQCKTNVLPTKFVLPTIEIRNSRNIVAKTRKLQVGVHKIDTNKEMTIMMLGGTGTGKSTFVDRLVNYIFGVEWGDPFRFTIVNLEDEERNRTNNQEMSQTEWITSYTIHNAKGNRIPYTLNIIDTPGFGDTQGCDRDRAIVKQIRNLFVANPPQGILTIDAICLFNKAPDSRLTAIQKYIFQSVISLFGNDIQNNICSVITFFDGVEPPVFAALDASQLRFGKRFTFNNYGLYATNTEKLSLSAHLWEHGNISFQTFFKHLETMQTKSIQLTADVLKGRIKLEATINNLQPKLEAGLVHVNKLKHEIQFVEENKNDMAILKQLSYTVKIPKQTKVDLPKGQTVLNCSNCKFTCQVNYQFSSDDERRSLSTINAKGHCYICPDNCALTKHTIAEWTFRYDVVDETKKYEDIQTSYYNANRTHRSPEQLINLMRKELEEVITTVESMIKAIMECNTRLQGVALHQKQLSITDYIDLMIENEEDEEKNGYIERIATLNTLKERAQQYHSSTTCPEGTSYKASENKDGNSIKQMLQYVGEWFEYVNMI